MSLAPGSRLGPYEILAAIGAGGMGEVYRARDTKLNREVAIKVLPPAFAQDTERMARFQREAQVLAALNHPNIAQIFGLVEGADGSALVMELVPGDMLHGPLPVDEAITIAKQIADALEAAHEKGIVHRDLKPANIKVTPDGKVKVLDFGLAKAMEESSPDIANSPTLSLGVTRAGVIMGTAAYMSPEQAKGKAVDRRADIWSFGVVLLEMLTGQHVFPGDNATEVIAGVILKDPAIPTALPPHIEQLLRRCLAKDPRQRLQAIGEARILLETGGTAVPAATVATPRTPLLPWAVAGAMGLVALLAVWILWPKPAKPAAIRRTTIQLGGDTALRQFTAPLMPAFDLSPDASMLVFVGVKDPNEKPQLYLRRLDQLKANPMSGTEGARNPFFSPDSQWVAFYAGSKLRKVSVSGGAPTTLCDAAEGLGGHWAEDGTILFTPDRFSPLMRVSSVGGSPQAVTKIDPSGGENAHRWPQMLPGGKAALYSAGMALNFGESKLVVRVIASGETKILQRSAYYGRYLPSGHLVFFHEGTMFAAPFDLNRLELTGQPVPVMEDVTNQPSGGAAQFAFAQDGTLVYLPATGLSTDGRTLFWMDRAGKLSPLRKETAIYFNYRLSPDGRSVVTSTLAGTGFGTWVYQWERGTMSRLSAEAVDTTPIWTPDGRRITYRALDPTTRAANLYWRPADGTGEAQRLTESVTPQTPESWHPSGKFLAFHEISKIMILPLEGDAASGWKPGRPYGFVANQFLNDGAAFSHDGRWLAYASNETGRQEVYVQPFPGPGGRWQISNEGGMRPVWSRAAKELLYRATDSQIMVASYVEAGGAFQAGKPRPWAENQTLGGTGAGFDVHPDGKRVVFGRSAQIIETKPPDHVVLVSNFFDEVRKIASGKR